MIKLVPIDSEIVSKQTEIQLSQEVNNLIFAKTGKQIAEYEAPKEYEDSVTPEEFFKEEVVDARDL